jgi:hypothetical protein
MGEVIVTGDLLLDPDSGASFLRFLDFLEFLRDPFGGTHLCTRRR